MQGFFVIYITPKADAIRIPEGFAVDYLSDTLAEPLTVYDDRFLEFDHQPDSAEILPSVGASETVEESRWWEDGLFRVRVRFPVTITQENRGGIVHLYRLENGKIPLTWGRAADFWGVLTTAQKHLQLHNYISVTLGFAPIAGAWAALDPNNQTQFLPNAVQTALGLTNPQQLARVTALRNGLQSLGYATTALNAIVAAPAGKTEDTLIRALVSDLGFTMRDLARAAIRID